MHEKKQKSFTKHDINPGIFPLKNIRWQIITLKRVTMSNKKKKGIDFHVYGCVNDCQIKANDDIFLPLIINLYFPILTLHFLAFFDEVMWHIIWGSFSSAT